MPAREDLHLTESIGIAGAGRIGQALGRLLSERGQPVAAVASRDAGRAAKAAAFIGEGVRPVSYRELPGRASRILIAVADDSVTAVADLLADAGMRSGAALHTCGALGPEALVPLSARGVSCGALHPLQTVATPEQGTHRLPGSTFAIDGAGAALEWAEQIARLLGARVVRIAPGRRALYHAAAVMASNYVVGLVDAAVTLMKEAGIEEHDALAAIAPLVRASAENALTLGPLRALTGPIERGDTETVATHLRALAGAPAAVAELYRCAGLHLVGLAGRKAAGVDFARLELLLAKKESTR